MARSLPFEIAPKDRFHEIGDDEQGLLKFRQRNGISIPERLAVTQIDRSDALFKTLGEFSVKIHRETFAQRELHEVYTAAKGVIDKLLQGGGGDYLPLEAEIALAHYDELRLLSQEWNANNEAIIVRQATVMIQNRLAGCSDWTDADTKDLDSEQLIVKIAIFYRSESAGGQPSEAVSAIKQLEELKEALGKLQQAPGNQPPNLTGAESTGDAVPPTQETLISLPSDSAPSPSPTSSTLSRPRKNGSGSGFTGKS